MKLNNFPYEQIRNRFDFRYNNNEAVERFYNRGKTWPALTYRCKKIDEDRKIWFRIEVEHNLYCGFVVAENGDNPGKLVLTYEEIERHINVSNGFCEDSWWLYWEYLLNDNEKSTPNFVNTNETMIKLFDREYFEKFVDLCVRNADGYIESALFMQESNELNTKLAKLKKDKKMILGNDECDKAYKKTEQLINILKKTGPIGEFDKKTFKRVVNRIYISKDKVMTYELINGRLSKSTIIRITKQKVPHPQAIHMF